MARGKHGLSRIIGRTVAGFALLALPCCAFAQRGGGGGHIGGPSAGGGAMGSGGRPTGVDVKDDLRTFHEIMAVQASREQIAAFALMVQSTAAAAARLKEFETTVGANYSASELAGRDKKLEDAVDGARLLNKNFLAGFSEKQKTGLKEILKRLGKTDSEMGQQAKNVDREVEENVASSQINSAAQGLDHALADFQRAQSGLGEEMSIPTETLEASTFNLTPVKNTFKVGDRAIRVTTSRTVSRADAENSAVEKNTFSVELTSDLSDLQLSIANVLRPQIDRTSGCGERIAVRTAELTPRAAAAVAEVQLHFERWACTQMMGREMMDEIVESNGSVEIVLTPTVADDGTLRVSGQVGNVRAEGLMAESLRTGALGEALRDKAAESVASLLRQCGDLKVALPPGAGNNATLKLAKFQGTGSGRLAVVFEGEIKVPSEQMQALIGQLGSASVSTGDAVPGPLLTRPATVPEATSR